MKQSEVQLSDLAGFRLLSGVSFDEEVRNGEDCNDIFVRVGQCGVHGYREPE